MKKFKKLIPAFCAMLVSAAMLGTSTYAWFSVNKKVEANNMSVTAVADTQYFVISNTEGSFTTATNNGQSVDVAAPSSSKAKPIAWGRKDTMTADGWYTANVNKYDSKDDKDIINVNEIKVESGNLYEQKNEYFIAYTFYIGLADGSSVYTGELNFLNIDDTTNGAAIAAIDIQQRTSTSDTWSDGTNKETLEIAHGTKVSGKDYYKSANSYTLSAAKAGAAQCVKVTVYVYLDGNNAHVVDSNAATLKGTVSVKVGASDIALAK